MDALNGVGNAVFAANQPLSEWIYDVVLRCRPLRVCVCSMASVLDGVDVQRLCGQLRVMLA
jgi:hypothetical protein